MPQISNTDTLFATVISNGTTLLSTRVSGMSSVAEILQYLRNKAGHLAGLITLRLRNVTCGWSADHSILLRPATVAATPQPGSYPSLFAAQGL